MMTTDYEYQIDDDWKKHDRQDHAAGADYYDEVARTQPAQPKPAVTRGDVTDNHHLKLARQQIEEYDRRINADRKFSDIVDRQVYEDRAYKQAMMHAAYAQAEAATRQAEVLEDMLEFAAELAGNTDLVDALLQWGYRQRAG